VTKIGKISFFSFLFFIFSFISLAQAQVVIKATVEQDEVALGEPFELTVSVVTKKSIAISAPRVPTLDGFDLKGQSSSSKSSYNMVQTDSGMDWQSQNQYDFLYILVPTRQGQLSIGAFEVVIEGQPQGTQPILVKVLPEGQRSRQQARPPRSAR